MADLQSMHFAVIRAGVLTIDVRPIADERVKPGRQALGTFFRDRLIVRNDWPVEEVDSFPLGFWFGQPRQLVFLANQSKDDGIVGQLYAIVPLEQPEPWVASVPSYEALTGQAMDGDGEVGAFCLGELVRIPADRRYPSYAMEAADLVHTVLREGAQEPVDRMLASLDGPGDARD